VKGNTKGIAPNQHAFVVWHIVRQWHAVDGGNDNVFRVAVEHIALLGAEATISSAAGGALAAASDDVHGDPVADGRSGIAPALHDLADHLVTGVAGQRVRSPIALHFATTDGRRTDLDQNLTWSEIGGRHVLHFNAGVSSERHCFQERNSSNDHELRERALNVSEPRRRCVVEGLYSVSVHPLRESAALIPSAPSWSTTRRTCAE
jgi:hypothetical protein